MSACVGNEQPKTTNCDVIQLMHYTQRTIVPVSRRCLILDMHNHA